MVGAGSKFNYDAAMEGRRKIHNQLRMASELRGNSRRLRGSSLTPLRTYSLVIALFMIMLGQCHAAWVNFDNCLPTEIREKARTGETRLQWVPLAVWAAIDSEAGNRLNVTMYGNVEGQFTTGDLPPPDDEAYWNNDNETFGKIPDLDPETGLFSTMFARFQVLNYVPVRDSGVRFCEHVLNSDCPVAPVFGNLSSPRDARAFSYANSLDGAYSFTTINPRLWVVNGDDDATQLACVQAKVTPALGRTLEDMLSYMPLLVLILVGVSTASAAIFSPWGTWDIFRWTSNYGRDAIQLRLITPGFGDCLQYIQFIMLSGSLTLNYPGFYQPVVSQVSWSSLMFNESFVTHGNGTRAIEDGIYAVNGSYGLNVTSQLVGMTSDQDMWAGMMIWLLVIIAAVSVLIQLGFVARWLYRLVTKTQEEDMRAKNFPFTVGNAVRIVFNYFLLPIVALSMYQLAIASSAPAPYLPVAFAAITIVVLLCFAGYLLWLIITARPRAWLFDDLPTVLLYGPLYNTYSDTAAPFALVPILITFVRGIAIGAVQMSGIAQIILLAICEIVNIMALNAFRPFSSPTSMNAYHTLFSAVRLVTVLLMIAYVPSLGINDAARGWIGYTILLLHGITLFVGFFLHALQTGIEVIARLAGAGGEGDVTAMGGFVRVFGLRQLSRRGKKRARTQKVRESMASNTAMLDQEKMTYSRSRSMSATSNLLLNNRSPLGDPRQSVALESIGGGQSHSGSNGYPYTPTTPGGPPPSAFSHSRTLTQSTGAGAITNLRSLEPSDPYFRAPRPRRMTAEMQSASPATSGDFTKVATTDPEDKIDAGEGPSVSGRATPTQARERADSLSEMPRTDYATREVDYYYGVRGPALSHMPTRKLKTGPADPTGPVSSATGWFKNLFGTKTKEQGKGFEVIRSSRMPPQQQDESQRGIDLEPYTDDPASPPRVKEAARHLTLEDEGDAVGGGTRHIPGEDQPQTSQETLGDGGNDYHPQTLAPILPAIDAGSSIHLPSRMPSTASSAHPNSTHPSRTNTQRRPFDEDIPEIPVIPPRSPRRASYATPEHSRERTQLSIISASPPETPERSRLRPEHPDATNQRMPFGSLTPGSSRVHNRSRSGDSRVSAVSTLSKDNDNQNTRKSNDATSAYREERPSSLGYVQQHRASDNIHSNNFSEHTLQGSTAELVNDPSVSRNNSAESSGK